VQVARERGALEVDVDGLGLALGEAERSSGEAELGSPGSDAGCLGGPVGSAGAPRRAAKDGAPDCDPRADLLERLEGPHRGDGHRLEEQVGERPAERARGVDDLLAADYEVGDL
jgi:hypothetical protein